MTISASAVLFSSFPEYYILVDIPKAEETFARFVFISLKCSNIGSCFEFCPVKGQTISKADYGVHNSLQKANETHCSKMLRIVSFVRFWGELRRPQIAFEIY